MSQELEAEELIEQARKVSGLEAFDSDSFREGLDVYLTDINEGRPPESATDRIRQNTVQILATRLQTTDYLDRHPDLLQRPVESPVFVFGMPRTGTTLLSNLFATDPARRSPLTWEIDEPVPPATTATLRTDPRALARLEQEKKMLEANPAMGKYYRSSAIYPNECVYFMAHDFKTLMLESRCKMLQYRDWLFQTDMTSAYQYHKRFLQLLQAEAPGAWNLKMPSHALWLETLLKVYPDARLVWTHRDPYAALGSFCSIIALSHRGFGTGVEPEWIGRNCLWQAEEHADRIINFREKFGEDRIVDVHYAELTRRPIDTMRALYAALGDEFSADVEERMQSWLDENPQDKFGKHEYRLTQYGLSTGQVASALERYMSRYEVEQEG
jgi:hypothetical protein